MSQKNFKPSNNYLINSSKLARFVKSPRIYLNIYKKFPGHSNPHAHLLRQPGQRGQTTGPLHAHLPDAYGSHVSASDVGLYNALVPRCEQRLPVGILFRVHCSQRRLLADLLRSSSGQDALLHTGEWQEDRWHLYDAPEHGLEYWCCVACHSGSVSDGRVELEELWG